MLSQGYPGRTHGISETLARIRILTKKEAQLKNVETLAIEGFLYFRYPCRAKASKVCSIYSSEELCKIS
jgi:hypothetical protein